MKDNYFTRLVEQTPTRVWVNNPTEAEIGLALAHGAVGSTTNPAYGGGLLKRAPGEVVGVIDRVLDDIPDASDRDVATVVQERLVERITEHFRPLYEESHGQWGYVSIQGSPETDTDGEQIWAEAQAGHAIAPNAAPKIPATLPGFIAMERVVEAGWPVILTEVFSLDQAVAACELYLRVTARTGVRSRFFMSPITGILGDHLKKLAAERGLAVPAASMEFAGIGLARRCARLVAEREYPVTLLFGGGRIPEDLIALVGAAHCATINWSTFAQILEAEPAIKQTIHEPIDADIERTLLSEFPDVWHAWELGRLKPDEFETFGPVQHFRDNFLSGWRGVVAEVANRRRAPASVG